MAIRRGSAARAGPDADVTEAAYFCQCCQVACHRFRPAKPCSFCHAVVCHFCSCGNEPHLLCKGCQPQVRGSQPAFSFRQLLWRFKMLPFGCHGEKWLFLVRKRQSFVVPTDLKGDEYQWLVHQLSRQRRLQGAHLEQQRTLDRDVDRTFQQLQVRVANSKRPNFLVKSQYSSSEFMNWKSSTHQLLSVFLMLKPQIGYCQGMTSMAAVLVQESKMNSEIAFRLFLTLTEKYRLDDVYGPDMKDVNLRYFQLDEALRLHLPRLHAHLSDRDIHPSTYASCWILTLFTECRLFPHRYVIAFLDLFFEFGWKVFFQVCLAIFSTIETPLLRQSTSGEIFAYLSKVTWFHRHKSDNDLDRFFATAKAFNVRSTLTDLELVPGRVARRIFNGGQYEYERIRLTDQDPVQFQREVLGSTAPTASLRTSALARKIRPSGGVKLMLTGSSTEG